MERSEEERNILKNIDEKLRWSRKKLKPMLEKESNSNKIRRQEAAGSDERTEVQESNEN